MNKSELIEKVAGATDLSKVDVDSALKAILASIVEEVAKGRKVTLVGFGTFESRKRKARVASFQQEEDSAPSEMLLHDTDNILDGQKDRPRCRHLARNARKRYTM